MAHTTRTELNIRIGIVIRGLRKSCGLSQKELADKVGVTQAYISMIENGNANSRINLNSLQNIAASLGFRLSKVIQIAEEVPEQESVVRDTKLWLDQQRETVNFT